MPRHGGSSTNRKSFASALLKTRSGKKRRSKRRRKKRKTSRSRNGKN